MRVLSGCVLLRITAAEKKKIFEKELITNTGDIATMIKDIEQQADLAGAYAQSVGSGTIVAVAEDVKHFQVGDIAILDYLVDTLKDEVVFQNEFGKILCLDVRTVFHQDDKMVYQSLTSNRDMYAWSKGDVDTASLIFGVFRDDQLIPNPPYLICEHKDFRISSVSKDGIAYQYFEEGARIRRVLVPNINSDEAVQPGVLVVVEDFCLYERSLDGKTFDVIMDRDIEMCFEQ